MEEEVSTVEIDGVLYEKNEDREGVITFTPVEQKTHKLEFTERELNMIANLIYVHTEFSPMWEDYNNGMLHKFSDSAAVIMEDIYQALSEYGEKNLGDDALAGIQSDFDMAEWKNCGDQQ